MVLFWVLVADLQCVGRYQFRIVAVNKAGESWPSYETKPHLARHKNLAPTIDKGAGGSKSVKVRAVFEKSFLDCQIFSQVNRMTVWRINVKGEPPPQFSWWKDGGKLLSHQDMINEGFSTI